MKKTDAFLLFFFILTCAGLFAQQKPTDIQKAYLPELPSLNARIPLPEEKKAIPNYLLKEYNDDVLSAHKAIAAGVSPTLQFYRYTSKKGDGFPTVLELSSRLNIPKETVATLNAIDAVNTPLLGKELILPTVPGIFIPKQPKSALDFLLEKEMAPLITKSTPLYRAEGREYYFLQGKRFSSTQLAFFLDTSIRMPLEDSVLTSDFGYRVSPISGTWKFHSGVDLAAPTGTPVYACKGGKVQSAVKNDPVFGNYIILQHANSTTSVYAHLSEISVKKDETVSKGKIIGKVGTTGASTGPHLHFEVRQNGRPMNPLRN